MTLPDFLAGAATGLVAGVLFLVLTRPFEAVAWCRVTWRRWRLWRWVRARARHVASHRTCPDCGTPLDTLGRLGESSLYLCQKHQRVFSA